MIEVKTKKCVHCSEVKPITDFNKCTAASDGLNSWCKKCCRGSADKTKEKYRERNVHLSPEYIRETTPESRCWKCKETKKSSEFSIDITKKYGLSTQCKSCSKLTIEKFHEDNPDYSHNYNLDYYIDNKDMIKKSTNIYYRKNKVKLRKAARANEKRRFNEDIGYKEKRYHLDRIRHILKGGYKNKCYKTEYLLGCSIEKLRKYLESKFVDGMSWENYGEWQVDHIKPIAAFDLTIEKEKLKCFNYKNLQPLWKEENIKKGSYYNGSWHKNGKKI